MGKRAKPEEIVAKLREVEVRLSKGETTRQAVRVIGATTTRKDRTRHLATDHPHQKQSCPRLSSRLIG